MAVIMAIAASAFTVISSKKAAGDQFGNSGSESSQYQKLGATYDPDKCSDQTNQVCGYRVTTSGASHVTGSAYSASEMATFLAEGWIEQIGTANGQYSE